MSKEYGKNITPILKEISDVMWEIDARSYQQPYEYGDDALPAACKIFMSVCMDKLWAKQQAEDTPHKQRLEQASSLGKDLNKLIKNNLGINSHDFYKDL